ncbi:7683_t:CDS:1, partial [Gigaspora rosea]
PATVLSTQKLSCVGKCNVISVRKNQKLKDLYKRILLSQTIIN